MNNDITGVDRGNLAEWAFAQMYRAMRLAEKAAGDYAHNLKIISSSLPGDRSIPTEKDMATLASDNKWFMQQAQTYASIFASAELADDSPHRDRFQRALQAVSASLGSDLIPKQRVPERK